MPSFSSQLVNTFGRRVIKRHDLEPQALVKHLRRAFNHAPALTLLPEGVRVDALRHASFNGDRVGVKDPRLTILYLHGGAFVAGVTRTYHNLAGRLAAGLRAEVLLPTYPFAPEHPFPAAFNRLLSVYEWLLAEGRNPANIVIAGDSAGGGLTLALLLAIRDRGLPRPRCAVTFSPASRAEKHCTLIARNCRTDSMLSASMINTLIDLYVPHEHRTNPHAIPALGAFHDLPPLFISVSRDECLYGDALVVRDKAQAAGVPVTWLERGAMPHVWPIMVPWLPEARADVKKVIRFVREHAPLTLAR